MILKSISGTFEKHHFFHPILFEMSGVSISYFSLLIKQSWELGKLNREIYELKCRLEINPL
ncbi:hypothetical protein [Niallia circulans]|uniref:hypothetical protein n=1 Tax=Niallia circulans TaxID=1397 RepID=UPI001F2B71A6|nr:hypothetical protein [Niallia circulans]MCF2649118.1 hypothetical protein [Niallia circulans]